MDGGAFFTSMALRKSKIVFLESFYSQAPPSPCHTPDDDKKELILLLFW